MGLTPGTDAGGSGGRELTQATRIWGGAAQLRCRKVPLEPAVEGSQPGERGQLHHQAEGQRVLRWGGHCRKARRGEMGDF